MKKYIILILTLSILGACNQIEQQSAPAEDPFPLKAYVETEDPVFRYEIKETIKGEDWTEYRVYLVSGTWLSPAEVGAPEWWHWLTMVVPDELNETESLIHIGGGWRGDTIPIAAREGMIQAALETGSVISHISNIPFQPLNYSGDQAEDVYEDELIAFAWLHFLQGGAIEDLNHWLPRFPMTRAVVRAMDVVQEICESKHKAIESFVVTGASKRGWTTWTVAAVDNRIIGAAPVVIDLLNVVPSFQHHWQCYGEWAPAINDYVQQGIMNWIETDEFLTMLKLIEPYQFLDRLTMPKLLINATGDEFFLTDSWKFYWNDLQGDNYLQYVPNVGHGLHGTYLPENLVSFYQMIISGADFPSFDWRVSNDTIYAKVDPASTYQIRLWEACNETDRDFKIYVTGEEAWQMESIELNDEGLYAITVAAPENGFKAALVEVVFNPDSEFPLTLTSGTLITPDCYPFDPFEPDLSVK